MPLLKVTAFDAGPSSSGVSMSQGETKGRAFFRIGLTEFAQQDLFGRCIDLKKEALKLVVNDDPKTRHLMGVGIAKIDAPDAIPLSGGPRGSVSCKVHPWNGGSGGKRPAVGLEVVNRQVSKDLVSVKLPEFARPPTNHAAAARG